MGGSNSFLGSVEEWLSTLSEFQLESLFFSAEIVIAGILIPGSIALVARHFEKRRIEREEDLLAIAERQEQDRTRELQQTLLQEALNAFNQALYAANESARILFQEATSTKLEYKTNGIANLAEVRDALSNQSDVLRNSTQIASSGVTSRMLGEILATLTFLRNVERFLDDALSFAATEALIEVKSEEDACFGFGKHTILRRARKNHIERRMKSVRDEIDDLEGRLRKLASDLDYWAGTKDSWKRAEDRKGEVEATFGKAEQRFARMHIVGGEDAAYPRKNEERARIRTPDDLVRYMEERVATVGQGADG